MSKTPYPGLQSKLTFVAKRMMMLLVTLPTVGLTSMFFASSTGTKLHLAVVFGSAEIAALLIAFLWAFCISDFPKDQDQPWRVVLWQASSFAVVFAILYVIAGRSPR